MITEEEKQEIINKAVEKALLLIPEVVGNMMAQQATIGKINAEFYAAYPEFKDYRDIVASAVEMEEGKNPTIKYEDLLKNAVPEIIKRIKITKGIDFTKRGVFNGDISRR